MAMLQKLDGGGRGEGARLHAVNTGKMEPQRPQSSRRRLFISACLASSAVTSLWRGRVRTMMSYSRLLAGCTREAAALLRDHHLLETFCLLQRLERHDGR